MPDVLSSGISNIDGLAAAVPLATEWERLADRAGAAPFARPGWIAAWTEAFGPAPVELVTIYRSSELAAALPLIGGRGSARAPANWHTPIFEPVAIDKAARDDLMRVAFERPDTSIELNLLDGSPATLDPIVTAAHAAGRLVLTRTVAQQPFIELEGDFAGYQSGLSSNRRKALRRQRRKLEEKWGTVSFEVHDGRTDLDELLEDLFRVEASGWKGERGTAISSNADTLGFYTRVARWAADHGWLRLAFLRLGDRAIACDYALQHGGVWFTLKAGYDERLRQFGPGALLLRDEIEHCYEQGLSRIELLGQDDAFKSSWTDRKAERVWLRAFRRRPAGVAAWAGFAAVEIARPAVRRMRQTRR